MSCDYVGLNGCLFRRGISIIHAAFHDARSAGSRLTFDPNEQYKFIQVKIVDDSIPEDDKFFEVELRNPTGGAAIDVGSKIRVVVENSDNAYGVFQFDNATTANTIIFEPPHGITSAKYAIRRTEGRIGSSEVTWSLSYSGNKDFVADQGIVGFIAGQEIAYFDVTALADSIPEKKEVFTLSLANITKGILGDNRQTSVSIAANDDPYGVFTISSTSKIISTTEGNKDVSVIIFRSRGSFGSVTVNYATAADNESFSFINPNIPRARATIDYTPVQSSVTFSVGQTEASFKIGIKDDYDSESDEAIYVVLKSVILNPIPPMDQVANSPKLGATMNTYSQIIVKGNDNGTSIILLSATDVTVFENQTGSVISIIRKGGMYGQVTVKFSVTPGLARYGEDYTVSSTDIVFANQETMKQLPIKIIDDPYPELAETFTVQLLEPLIGNAIMGSPIKATVTIEASDDPLGTFDFAKRSVIVDEPSTGQKTNVDIQVVRTGGNLGVPAVSWQTTYDGVPPTTDIKPTSGVLHFVSNETSLPVKIEVLPDTKPEGNQNINVTLVSVTNGGHIGPNNNFILTIRANDNPHGTVEFIGDTFTVYESANSTTQYVTANRIGGTVSDVRVYYSLQEIDPLSLLAKSGRTMLSYFAGPIERNATSTGQKIDIVTDPLNASSCGSACLASKSCMTFELTVSTNSCHLYNKLDMATITSGTGTQYYTKKTLEANSLYMEQAQAGVDYAPVSNGQAIMKDGEDVVGLPISILQDNIPELNEQLIIKLEKVELVNDTQGSKELPKLGNKTLASVVIATNDNAYGLFRIFSNDPRASQNGSQVAVDEQDNLAVELQVERTGGSLGDVSVDWFIDTATSTAIAGNDYEAGGGITLLFAHGQIRKTITVAIRDDTLPENDESVIVKLGKPTGGASIGSQGVVDVIIKANDDVAGRIGFQQKSIVVHEGEKVNLVVERSSPALGNVSVYWMIERVKGLPPHQSFRQSTGYLLFIQGQLKADLQLEVLKDNLPEVHEEYNIRLWNLSVSGIRSEGVASLDPQRYNLGLSIRGSDDPHGIIGFALSSQKVTTVEANKTLDLTIERKFGTIGAVLVNFTVKQGNVTALNSEQELATAGKDFLDYGSGVVIRDGSTSATMKVYILDDSIPEVDEVFIVQLLNVSLIQPKISPLQPALASSGTTAEILIKANDGTKGVVFFSAESAKKSVNETAGEVVLSVIRSMGTFGNVSVYCYAQPGSATIGVDFIFDPQDIVFAPGQSKRDITVQIVNDGKAEPPETFELVLASPKNGVQLGVPNKAEVTIGPSDDASGFVSFSISDVIYLNEPSATSSVNSQVEIPILRGPGLYGKILVPFKITRVGNTKENVTDVTPTSGFITILDSQTSGSLMIQALADNIAELDEAFVIELSKPQGGAQLGKIIRRSLIIRQNDSPYGLMQIYPKSSSANTIDVEEDVGRVEYRIVRQGGTRGTISVNVFIEASSAQAPSGTTVFLSKYQKLPAKYPVGWSSLKIGSTTYGVLLNRYSIGSMNTLIGSNGAVTGAKTVNNSNIDQYSMVYRWQGVYRPVQTLETNGASFATSFNIGGKSYFLVINSGAIGNYETKSRLYEINEAGVVKVIQDFYTRNGQKATVFTQGLDQFAVIVNYQDNSGETNINSELYKWEQNAGSFSSMAAQYISTIGARDVTSFKINQQLYLCIANNYDSKTRSYEIDSILYKFNSSAGLFAITQRFQTKGATALSSFSWGNDRYLIIANSRDNFGDTKQDVIVYKWNFVLNAFVTLQNIPSISTSSLDIFQMDGIVFLTVASSSASAIHEWNPANLQFQPVWNGSSATSIYPNIIPQTNGFLTTMMISSKDLKRTDVYIFSRLSKSADFVPMYVNISFEHISS
ncbi:adhesion G-protein coupled receptor V1-like [Tubulanus polymorphus]|uniref:adhesion G-protein coupled receptor V1-like n=1 Tax=Tubulanus polymorphus TaxID=672921 RepID=UPI003DA2E259